MPKTITSKNISGASLNKNEAYLKGLIRDVPNFPKPGVIFKDITPLLKDGKGLRIVCDQIADHFSKLQIDLVIGIESRGFIFSPMIAYKLGAGFVPVRKKGKLPSKVERVSYSLEYGDDFLEIHLDAIVKNEQVLIVDDVLATGGTAEAVRKLVEKLGGKVVGFGFVIELLFLKGRERLSNFPIHSLIQYS